MIDLSDEMRVSSVTIRKDLEVLEKRSYLRRIRGGAVAARAARFELPLSEANQSLIAEKTAIGRAAAAMVRDGQTIMVDAGSTNLAFVKALPMVLIDVVLVTNSLDIAIALDRHPGVSTFVTGGALRRAQRSLVAPFGNLMIQRINADIAFLSCAGIDLDKGFTNSNWEEAEIKVAMRDASARSVFLADHSKFGHVGSARIVGIDEAQTLVTDSGAPPALMRDLEAKGLQVIVSGRAPGPAS